MKVKAISQAVTTQAKADLQVFVAEGMVWCAFGAFLLVRTKGAL